MQKLFHLTALALLMVLFFSAPAINVEWTPVGPNDALYQHGFSSASADRGVDSSPADRSPADSLALFVGGLVMILSASFLRRLSA